MQTTDTQPISSSTSIMTLPSSPENRAPQDDATLQMTQMLSVSVTVLRQAVDLVDNYLTSDEQLTIHSRYLPGSTIGKHLRHARDHFTLLADCISKPPPYILSYDIRSRNTPMESSRSAAREALLAAIAQLEGVIPTVNLHEPLILNAVTPHEQTFQTTFGREVGSP
ncbi:hypothetical protein AX16_005590 [Volvariella volvacea WC 439]|nr:hypothetical protein AX16_005590 [Volvariella volvacea WC 439]